jgi:hypothetical protein
MTIRAYFRDGKLKGKKLGVQWYITEEAIRGYFDEPPDEPAPSRKRSLKYIVQGVNDLVSETEECRSIDETLDTLSNQAIISLFQVKIVDAESGEVLELIKARDFIERYN